MSDKQVCELLNTRTDVHFQLTKFEDLEQGKKIRVLSLRNRKSPWGAKVMIELENDLFIFLPARYTDLFIKDESDNFIIRTPTLIMTIVDFFTEVNDKGEPYVTPILNFSTESGPKRSYTAAKTGGGNSSVDALASTSKAFDAKKGKSRKLPETQSWDDNENW